MAESEGLLLYGITRLQIDLVDANHQLLLSSTDLLVQGH